MRIVGGDEVDPGQHILGIAFHTYQAAIAGKFDSTQHVARVHRAEQPTEAAVERNRVDPISQFALLDIEFRIREKRYTPHVIEMRMRDENMFNFLRRDAAGSQYFPRAMPIFDLQFFSEGFSLLNIVVAAVDERRRSLAFDKDVAKGKLECSLVMQAIHHGTLWMLADVAVLKNVNRIVRHNHLLTLLLTAD